MQSPQPQLNLRPLKATDLLDSVFGIYSKNVWLLVAIACFFQVPYQLISGGLNSRLPRLDTIQHKEAHLTAAQNQNLEHFLLGVLAFALVLIVLNTAVVLPIQAAAMIRVSASRFTGVQASLGDSYRRALQQPQRLALLMVIYLGATVVSLLVLGLILALIDTVVGKAGFLLDLVVTLGAGLTLASYYLRVLLAVPAMVLERLRPVDALRRSWALTHNQGRRILGVALVLGLVQVAGTVLVAIVLGFVEGFLGSGSATAGVLEILGAVVSGVAVAPVFGCGLALLYWDLRVREENFSTPDLAAQLAD